MGPTDSPLSKQNQCRRHALMDLSPEIICHRTGATYINTGKAGRFQFKYLGEDIFLPTEDFVAREKAEEIPLDIIDQALITYYFFGSNPTIDPQGWISFSELPNGEFFASAFKALTSKKMLQYFKDNYSLFMHRSLAIGGSYTNFASEAYRIKIFPKVDILTVCWRGDEELPPSYQILFQNTIAHHLPTEACAILGNLLTSELVNSPKRNQTK